MSALSRAYRMGADARAATIAAWLRTLVDWNVPLERAAEMIEAGVPWSDSEQPLKAGDMVNLPSPASKPFPACRVVGFEATSIPFADFMGETESGGDGGSNG